MTFHRVEGFRFDYSAFGRKFLFVLIVQKNSTRGFPNWYLFTSSVEAWGNFTILGLAIEYLFVLVAIVEVKADL